jgi:hypothetical protein
MLLAALSWPAASMAQSAALGTVAGTPGSVSRPLSREERVHWFLNATVGPKSLGAGVVSAAWGTAFNNPEEYGPHWDGFAKRYGMRLTGVATSNAIEAGLGSLWGEDPRYTSVGEGNVWSRVRNAARMTVVAERADGSAAPAYARYAAISGGNFLSNTWRVDSDSTAGAAWQRTGLGFAGRFASNVFEEFWPDLRHKLFGRKYK